MPSLLNFENSIVEEIHIRKNPRFKKDKTIVLKHFKVSCQHYRRGQEPKFMINMSIGNSKPMSKSENYPYSLKMRIRGFFGFRKDTPEETMDRMIALNGVSILYGLARGIAMQNTANFQYGKFILPTMNFTQPSGKKAAAPKK